MVDKMMRMAGRGPDGLAKAIKTDTNGKPEVRINNKETLYSSKMTLPANSSGSFFFDATHVEFEITFRAEQSFTSRVVLDRYIKIGSSNVLIGTDSILAAGTQTTRTVRFKAPACDVGRIRILNDSQTEQNVMGILLSGITTPDSPASSTTPVTLEQAPIKARNKSNAEVFLNAEVDADGLSALRIVDAAPWGYVIEKDAIRVVNDKKMNHLLGNIIDVTVPAGGYTDIEGYYDISDFREVMATVRFGTTASAEFKAIYAMEGSTFAMEDVESHSSVQFASVKFGVKTGTLRCMRITNKGTTDMVITAAEVRGLR